MKLKPGINIHGDMREDSMHIPLISGNFSGRGCRKYLLMRDSRVRTEMVQKAQVVVPIVQMMPSVHHTADPNYL